MATDDKIRDEKLLYDMNREAVKILALSSGKTDKYEYVTGEEILPSDQGRVIEQATFTYFPFGKGFEKKKQKTVVDQGIKEVEALKVLKPEENQEPESTEGRFPKKKMRNNEIKNKIDGIKNWEENIKQEDLKQISIYIWFSAIWKR